MESPYNIYNYSIKQKRSYNSNVIVFGNVWDITNEEALRLSKLEENALYVSPFDHELIW